ncbi:hypothetical protein [Niveibacterium sp. SC-1]|uniref:hypothetical protein n=1 Tax=Niveibacterium sp. SC-1 TaxID=3135646 RepID=UPI00311DCB51
MPNPSSLLARYGSQLAHSVTVLTAAILPMLSSSALGRPACTVSTERQHNRDGSELHLTNRACPDTGVRTIEVTYKRRPKDAARVIGQFEQKIDDSPTGGGSLDDWDHDGNFEVGIAGRCGAGPNCEGQIYMVSPDTGELYLFFDGGFFDVQRIDEYLVASGRSSCCEWCYSAYALSPDRRHVYQGERFGVCIRAPDDGKKPTSRSQCKIYRRIPGGERIIPPPSPQILALCREYGDAYDLVKTPWD